MSANPHVVTADAVFTWDHAPARLGRGTILDVPPDSPLMAAIGADKLKPLFGAAPAPGPQAVEPEPELAASEPAQAPAKAARNGAKATPAAKGGGDAP